MNNADIANLKSLDYIDILVSKNNDVIRLNNQYKLSECTILTLQVFCIERANPIHACATILPDNCAISRDCILQPGPWKKVAESHNDKRIYDLVDDIDTFTNKSAKWIYVNEIYSFTSNIKVEQHSHMKCARCNEPNEYAQPNMNDGVSYRCYQCRKNPWR